MTLDFSPLARAVLRLEEGLARYLSDPGDDQVRDGLIQRFEFTYDLSHKMLRRALQAGAANPEEVSQMSFPALIRTGNEQGLLMGDWPAWQGYREMRNVTSHTYDEGKARWVTQAIPAFVEEARALVRRLEDHAG